ncbi:MAG: Ig-like domain-containing protein [Phycisphaerales bacterium]
MTQHTMNTLKYATTLLALALSLALTPLASAQGDAPDTTTTQKVYASFSNGQLLPIQQVTRFDFTVTTRDTVYFMFSAPTFADAFILNNEQFQNFRLALPFTAAGGFRNQSGRQTITLAAGNYTVGVKNTGGTGLDYAFRVVSAANVQTIRASGTEVLFPNARFTKSFTVNPGDQMLLSAVGEGLEGFVITPSEVNKFKGGVAFTPVGGQQILTDLASGSASGEITLNEGTFNIAFRNPTAINRPLVYVVSVKRPPFNGGGPVNPPSDVVPFFDSRTDEGVGGTFDGAAFRTRFNNRNPSLAPSFLVSGCTPGQFVRVYAGDDLIAQGVAGSAQLTLKANGRFRLEDGTYTLTASQFNGQTESERDEFFDLVIDTLAPVPPDNLDLVDASDTGPSADDNITSASQLTFTGTAEPLARVMLTLGGRVSGSSSVQADENGDWTSTVTVTRTGKVKFAALQLDTAGNPSRPSPNLEVTLLKRPNAPGRPDLIKADKGRTVNGAVNTSNPNPTIIGSAGKGNTVTLEIDGQDSQSVVVPTNGRWSIALEAPLALGEHIIRAKQTDLAGGVSPLGPGVRIRLVEPQ